MVRENDEVQIAVLTEGLKNLNLNMLRFEKSIDRLTTELKQLRELYILAVENKNQINDIRKDVDSIQASVTWITRITIGAVVTAILGLFGAQQLG